MHGHHVVRYFLFSRIYSFPMHLYKCIRVNTDYNLQFFCIIPMSSSVMKKVSVSVKSDKQGDFPLVVSFPQGVPADVEEANLVVGHKSSGKSSSKKTMISADINGMRCIANDFGENSSKNDSNQFAVGVYNSETKKMKLYPANHIFVLKPQNQKSVAVANSSLTNMEKRTSLTEEFGSRKKKRAMQAAQSNIISAENISGAGAIEKILSRSSTGGGESALQDAVQQTLLRNKKASNKRK